MVTKLVTKLQIGYKTTNLHDMLEQKIEQKCCEYIHKLGGKALKFTSNTQTGYPDRLVILPWVPMFFVEFKAPGKKPTKLQAVRHKELDSIGHPVFVIDNYEAFKTLINDLNDI